MRVAILVGRRPDGGRRDLLWDYCRATWQRELPDWPIFEGRDSGEGPFSLAAASNDAAREAGDWDVCLYVGADVVLGDPRRAAQAVDLASKLKCLVFAHDHYYSLSQEGTFAVLTGEDPHGRHAEWPAWPNTFSSALAVTRELWDEVGGFDERFVGWGFEDLAMWSACCALAGRFERVTGPVFHLHHERDHAKREGSKEHADNEPLGSARTPSCAPAP